MRSGWQELIAIVVVVTGCKAARDYAEKRYDERRAVEKAEERAGADRAAREEAERPPTPKPSGPGLPAGTYRLRAVAVTAFATTAKNRPWDSGLDAAPDLLVRVDVDGKTIALCKGADDTVEARCTYDDVEFELDEASRIVFDVVDRDAIVDDPVGTASLDDPSTWGTDLEMQLVPRSRIRSASVTLGAVPTWWDRHGTNVLLAAGAVVVVFGGFYAARRWLGPRRVAGSAGRRCTACGARLANYAKCSDCGADQPASVS